SAQWTRANPTALLVLLQLITAVISAFLNNVTTVLLMAPVTLAITRELKVPPYPFLFAEVFASNIGGTATLIGDPPNIMIGSLAGLDFNAFVIHLAPVIVLVQTVQLLIMHAVWGRHMGATALDRVRVMAMDADTAIVDRPLLAQSVGGLGAAILAFVAADALHLEAATIAIAAAAVLMVFDNWRWCLALGACLGGNGTLIGASANLIIAGFAERNGIGFGFVKFTLYARSEEHTSELQSLTNLVCRLLLENKKIHSH